MGIMNTVKNFFVAEDEDLDFEEFENEVEVEEEIKQKSTTIPFQKKSKIVPMSNVANSQIVVLKPKKFDDSTLIADAIKDRKPVVFDVGGLQPEEARRVVDFVAGAAYGVDGRVQRVSGGIFIATPANIDIFGESDSKGDVSWNMI